MTRRSLRPSLPALLLLAAAAAFAVWQAGPSVGAFWQRTDIAGKRVWLFPGARVAGHLLAQRTGYRQPDGTVVPMIDGKPRPGAPWPEAAFVLIEHGGATADVGLQSGREERVTPGGAEFWFAWLALQLRN